MMESTSPFVDQIDSASIVKMASDLIKFRTESDDGSDFEKAANYLLRRFEKLGLNTMTLGSDDRPILVGTRTNNQTGINIFLNGHYDVVPTGDLAAWDTDPFKPIVKEGKLFGRGAADMKGSLAVICDVTRILASDEVNYPGNLYITMTPDEEIGSKNGAELLINSQILPQGENCFGLMPECSGLDVIWHAAKGTLWYNIKICGKQAHSTLPSLGINTFEKMCELVHTRLSPLREEVEKRRSELEGGYLDSSYSVMNIGGYSQGEASINTIPGSATFSIDRRVIPEEDIQKARDEIESRLMDYSSNSGIPIEV